MDLKEPILKLLAKQYEPSTLVETTFKRYDIAFKTDDAGRPILLFMVSETNWATSKENDMPDG